MKPLDAGFIDLPQQLLDQHRRQGDASTLGRILKIAARLRDEVDRVVILGIGGSYMGGRALFEALRSSYHNDLPAKDRGGAPRIYFEGNNADSDALNDLLQMLQITCVDPELREERWGAIAITKSGATLETAVAYRVFRRELSEFYGNHSPKAKNLAVPVTGASGKMRALLQAEGYPDETSSPFPTTLAAAIRCSRRPAFCPPR